LIGRGLFSTISLRLRVTQFAIKSVKAMGSGASIEEEDQMVLLFQQSG
jgi:hypothetical protein